MKCLLKRRYFKLTQIMLNWHYITEMKKRSVNFVLFKFMEIWTLIYDARRARLEFSQREYDRKLIERVFETWKSQKNRAVSQPKLSYLELQEMSIKFLWHLICTKFWAKWKRVRKQRLFEEKRKIVFLINSRYLLKRGQTRRVKRRRLEGGRCYLLQNMGIQFIQIVH